ncbi:MAG: ribonuclease III [Deltaproteobacteria bacterium]|nr:ribonuclease III [Deltaproteobacteria bacterium]
MDEVNLPDLELTLEYHFKDPQLLDQSLCHRSFVNENPGMGLRDNELLEFLGDAVLELAIRSLLMSSFPMAKEGELTKIKSSLVNEASLAMLARDLNLGKYLKLGRGEELTHGREKDSLLADCFEAVIGAVYQDGGLDPAEQMIEVFFTPLLDRARPQELVKDFKTMLQEHCQEVYKETPDYNVEREIGPDHNKTFFVTLSVQGKILARGQGRSKKTAEQAAAQEALQGLGIIV